MFVELQLKVSGRDDLCSYWSLFISSRLIGCRPRSAPALVCVCVCCFRQEAAGAEISRLLRLLQDEAAQLEVCGQSGTFLCGDHEEPSGEETF